MKKYTKIFLVLLAAISLLSIVVPVIPPHTWYSKYVLTNNSILSKLGLNKNECNYQEAQILIEAHSAYISCITTDSYRLASDSQKAAIDEMRNILEQNGWELEKENRQFWDITFRKGLRKIRIYPYDWGPGCTGVIEDGYNTCKLFIMLS